MNASVGQPDGAATALLACLESAMSHPRDSVVETFIALANQASLPFTLDTVTAEATPGDQVYETTCGQPVFRARFEQQNAAEPCKTLLQHCANIVARAPTPNPVGLKNPALVNALFDVGLDLLCLIDQQGNLQRVNHIMAEALGYTPAEMAGRNYIEFVHPEDQDETQQVENRIKGGHSVSHFVNRYRTRTGSYRFFEWTTAPIQESQYILGSARDITESVLDFQRLKQVKDDAAAANRVKSEFLSVMSHEIRTPMNAIVGFAELLSLEADPATRDEFTQHIISNSQQLLGLIDRILDYAQTSSREFRISWERFSPPDTIRSMVDVFGEDAGSKGLTLKTVIGSGVPAKAMGDPKRFERILQQILSNAVKFTLEGGIVVKADATRDTLNNEWIIVVSVTDTGIGIAPDFQSAIFDPFQQVDMSLKRNYSGTGLGLAVSRELARRMGGDITVHSSPGKGSTFNLSLRCGIDPGDIHNTPLQSQEEEDESQALRIICAEDISASAQLIEALLRHLGHAPRIVADGQELLDTLRTNPCDILLLDLQMPRLDGFQACRAIREGQAGTHHKNLYIIGLTAMAAQEDREKCLSIGMDDFLAKPIRFELLEAALEHARQALAERSSA